MQPDLGGQIAQVIASLEKATPQVLAMAERSYRMEAALYGALYTTILVLAIILARWIYRWVRSQKESGDGEEKRFAAWAVVFGLSALAIVMLCQLPDQVNQFANARYYAVCDLLRRVHP